MTLSIDVVVPTLEYFDLTERCLRCLRDQTVPHRVVVVDSGSRDGTPERVRAEFPEAEVIELGANLGYSAACNRGAASGAGEVVVLLNNDAFCRPDFLERAVAPFADEQVGSVATLTVQEDEQTIDAVGIALDPTLAVYMRLHGRPVADAASAEPVLAGPGNGADVYRRAAWEQVGGLDEAILAHLTDVDMALRLGAAGWRAAAAPDAVAVHLRSATAGTGTPLARELGGLGRGYIVRRYGLLRSRLAPRTLAAEALGQAFNLLAHRDTAGLRGFVRGWRAAGGLPRRPVPDGLVEPAITLAASLALRRAASRKIS